MRLGRSSSFLLALLVLGSSPVAAGDAKKTITLRADVWCPFNCEPGSDHPGYMIEVATKVFARHGIKVDYATLAWSRALEDAAASKIDGIIATTKKESPTLVFPPDSLGDVRFCFYTKADDKWTYALPASLKGKKIGTIKDYFYGDFSEVLAVAQKQHGAKVEELAGDGALNRNISKLKLGRLDVVIDSNFVMQHTLRSIKGEKDFRESGCSAPVEHFVAFAPGNPEAKQWAAWLAEGVAELRNNGGLGKILERYALKDWR